MKALYKTDFNHSFNSRDLIGVFTNKAEFKRLVTKIIRNELSKLDDTEEDWKWHVQFMMEKNQTQGLPDFELFAEEITPNIIF